MPENPDDMRSYADNSAQSVTQKAGNGLKKGLKAAGRGLKNQGKKYLHRASAKPARSRQNSVQPCRKWAEAGTQEIFMAWYCSFSRYLVSGNCPDRIG